MKAYNGHPSWNHWNVTLWISNDEALYREAVSALRTAPNRKEAARAMLAVLPPATPDGAPYTISTVLHALKGFDS